MCAYGKDHAVPNRVLPSYSEVVSDENGETVASVVSGLWTQTCKSVLFFYKREILPLWGNKHRFSRQNFIKKSRKWGLTGSVLQLPWRLVVALFVETLPITFQMISKCFPFSKSIHHKLLKATTKCHAKISLAFRWSWSSFFAVVLLVYRVCGVHSSPSASFPWHWLRMLACCCAQSLQRTPFLENLNLCLQKRGSRGIDRTNFCFVVTIETYRLENFGTSETRKANAPPIVLSFQPCFSRSTSKSSALTDQIDRALLKHFVEGSDFWLSSRRLETVCGMGGILGKFRVWLTTNRGHTFGDFH